MRTLLLHLEGIASLDEEVGGLLVLVFSPAKEAEAATGALELLLSLSSAKRQHKSNSAWRCSSSQDQGGGGVTEPFGGELEDLEPWLCKFGETRVSSKSGDRNKRRKGTRWEKLSRADLKL
jgi:hypothetical protein